MEDQGGTKNKEKSQTQKNEKEKHGPKHEIESQSEYESLPELLQVEKIAKKKAMDNAIKENMKAVKNLPSNG
jgi:hypothetical protein